ncbi:hypothetical protein V1264_005919 [Littorina saxatilis]|uniref:Uncharacterized protein n=1 Tax=Littorina saxatilis TaxID=31220 RepID=A0AAN9AY54_9CAEN
MALVHSHSSACVKSELDLFAVPSTQSQIDHGQWVEYHPVATLTDQGPLEFYVAGTGDDYIDLANTLLVVSLKITNQDGSNLAEGANVGPTNLFLHSLFSQVDLSLNEKLVSSSTNTYPYRAYIETLLSYGPAAKASHLTAALWAKDTAGHMHTGQNDGFTARSRWTASSQSVELMGRLHGDLFFQERYLINGVNLRIRLVRSKDSFSLMSGAVNPNFKVKLQSAVLYIRKVKLQPSVQLAHIKALEKTTVKYPIRRVETKIFSVSNGNLTVNQENLFLGQLPRRVVIGCVDNEAFNGSYPRNPFEFQHHSINFLALYVDGMQVPAKPLQPDFDERHVVRSYLSLFLGTERLHQDEGNDISIDDYDKGYTLFAFDLTPDLSNQGHFELIKEGNVRLEMHFAKALPRTINIIVDAEFDNIIEIDRSRNVLFDYSA